jgi:light-harvesting complex I chlorophyll a/b binding protein 1/light-harvesting complex I chlorophyll a/b binding protein 4
LERKKVVQGRFSDLSGAAKTQGKAGVNPFGNAVDVGFQDPEKFVPGDLGFDPVGFTDNGINPDYALAEIKHARLAMLGAAGMLIQEFLQPKGILSQTVEWAQSQ